ncbi:MAG: hypothetical protein R3E67_02395 [Pseudomonadales bacterium]
MLQRVSGMHKIEGIALAQNGQLYAVTDADDPALPASLLLFRDGISENYFSRCCVFTA